MDKAQKSKKNMIVKLLAFLHLASNAAIYALFTPMVNLVKKINDDNEYWNGLITKEAAETTGITADQDNAKHLMTDEWGMLAKSAYGYALSINNQTLAENWNYSSSQLYSLGMAESAAACDKLMQSIGPFLPQLMIYGITAAELIIADNMITSFEGYLGQSKSGEAVKSAAGIAMDTLIKETLTPELVTLDANVASFFFKNQKDFREGYAAVRALDDLPTHHTQLEVQFYIKGTTTPIIGAKIRDTRDKGKTAVANNVGIANLVEFKGGENLMFEASHPEYITLPIVKTVPSAKKVSIIVELEPIPVVVPVV